MDDRWAGPRESVHLWSSWTDTTIRDPGSLTRPPSTAWRRTFSSLENRDFRLLWFGMLAWMCGMQMQMLARAYLVYELTDGNAAILGVVSAANALPLLVLALFGGVIADRLEGKRIIQISQVALGLLALFIGLSITSNTATWYHLLGGAIAHGALVSFMMPARQAIIPRLVGQQGISNAMSLNAAGMSAATVMAPAIGGNVYAFFGPDGAYYMISGLFLLSVILTTFLPHIDAKGTGRTSMMSDIKAGLSYIGRSPLVAVLLITAMGTTLLAMPFRFLMPVFVVDIYNRGPDDMGLLLAMMGIGTLIGSLFIAAIGQWHRGLLLLVGGAITGLTLLSLALFPFYYLAVALMLFLGLGDAGRRALNQALVMEVADDAYRGRVWSVVMMTFGLVPLGVLPAGLASEYLGGEIAISILAGLLLSIVALLLITQKRLRELN